MRTLRNAGASLLLILLSGAAYARVPTPPPPHPGARALQRQLRLAMRKAGLWHVVVRPAAGQLRHSYLIPGAGYYQLFDWDSYFMGLALSYRGRGHSLAGVVEDFLGLTGHRWAYRGYTPREATPRGLWALPEQCKPFLAQMALRASLTLHSAEWLRPYYQRLKATLSFWRQARRSPDGLFTWFDGVESGVDNSPAVSSRPADRTEGVDLACYIVREYRALAALARMLHHPADADFYQARARILTARIQTRLWDAHAGTFYNRDSRTGKFIRVPEWTNLSPLWARVATPAQARILIHRYVLNSRQFWTPYGIRSLAPSSPEYNPASGYWRGPIWIVTDYMVMHGLMNYGDRRSAGRLARNAVAVLLRDFRATGGMHECYNPHTGQGESQGHFESWDLLGAYLVHEARTGANPAAILAPSGSGS